MMKCKRPTIWKARCGNCGIEICRFISKPNDNWRKEPCTGHQMCYKNDHFSNFFNNFLHLPEVGSLFQCPSCRYEDNFILVEEEWTNRDAILFFAEIEQAAYKCTEACNSVNKLRKYIDCGKIDKESINILYQALEGIMGKINILAKQRCSIDYLDKEVVDDICFCTKR